MNGMKDELLVKAKKVIKQALRRIAISIAPFILIFFIIVIVVASIVHLVKVKDGSYDEEDKQNVPHIVDKSIHDGLFEDNKLKIVKKEDGTGYKIDVNINDLAEKIIDQQEEVEGRLGAYLETKDEQKEYLAAFIKAELITEYPDLRVEDKIGKPTDKDEFQGAIKVKRRTEDGGEKTLTFIPEVDFNGLVKANKSDSLKYFTLDSSGQIEIAGYNDIKKKVDSDVPNNKDKDSEQYTIQTTSINYKPMLAKYDMPFELLWAMLVTTTEPSFVKDVASLSDKSDIVVSAFDNVTITQVTDTEKYKQKDETSIVLDKSSNGTKTSKTTSTESDSKYHKKIVTTTTTDTVSLAITKADTWVAKYTKDFKCEKQKETVNTSKGDPPADAQYYKVSESKEENVSNDEDAKKAANEAGDEYEIEAKYHTTYLKDNGTDTEIKVNGNNYTETKKTIEEKLNPEAKEDNFAKLMDKYGNAKTSLLDAGDWFFEMLSKGKNTANMVDLMKYVLYKTTDYDFGVTTYDFDIVDMTGFNAIGGKCNLSGVPGQMYDFLLSKGVPPVGAAAILGNVQQESDFQPNCKNEIGASGLFQYLDERLAGLNALASSKGKTWEDVDCQLEYMWSELNGHYKFVKDVIMNAKEEKDLEYATWFWGRHYEVFYVGDYANSRSNADCCRRHQYAIDWYNQWKLHHTDGVGGEVADEKDANTQQLAIANVARNCESYGIPHNPGMCLQWTSRVYQAANVPITLVSDAATAGNRFGCSTDLHHIPVGAMVFGAAHPGNPYGHVGIYMGNRIVKHNLSGTVKETDIGEWVNSFWGVGWGWCDTTAINSKYPPHPGLLPRELTNANRPRWVE